MTGFEPGPPEHKPFIACISAGTDDLFSNCRTNTSNSVQDLYSMDDSPEMMKGYRKC